MIMDIAAIERLGFEIALGAYLISSILFILYLSSKKRRLADMGFTLTAFGFAFQTLALITRWFYAGHPPWVNTYEVMSFFAWTIVGAYLVLNIRTDYKSVGTLVHYSLQTQRHLSLRCRASGFLYTFPSL
jgi:ABC-type transport system involved in cytochrome c biogenesis permease subunit